MKQNLTSYPAASQSALAFFSPALPLRLGTFTLLISATLQTATAAVTTTSAVARHTLTENTTDLTATTLMVTGIILLLLEIKIISQGILAFLGTASLIAATILIWRDGTPFWGIPIGWIIPVIIVIIIVTGILTWLALQAQKEKIVTGYQGFIGEIAETREPLDPEGRVFFNGTYWDAISQTPIATGQKVRIIAADRLKLIVEPLLHPPTE